MGENNTSIEEAVRDLEQKHRKRGGGLGDVYQDKCTEGTTTDREREQFGLLLILP